MIIAVGFLVIVCATTIAILRSKKPLKLILREAKFEILYNAVGSKYLMQDFLMKKLNKTGKFLPGCFYVVKRESFCYADLPSKSGKTAVITGGTRGIGLEVIKLLLKCDINVIVGRVTYLFSVIIHLMIKKTLVIQVAETYKKGKICCPNFVRKVFQLEILKYTSWT